MRIKRLETFSTRYIAFVRATLEDGSFGWGQLSTYNSDITADVFHRQAAPWVLGEAAWPIDPLIDRIEEKEHKFPGAYLKRAMAGLDTALWDLESKRQEQLRFQGLVVVTLGASVLDVMVTYWALSHHWAMELNPFAVHSIGALGLRQVAALNLALRLVIVGLLAWIAAAAGDVRARVSARWMLTAIALWWTLVAVVNVVVLGVSLH